MKEKKRIVLTGGTYEKDGMFGGRVAFETHDGKKTERESGPIYHSKEEAVAAVEVLVNGMAKELNTLGAHVVSRNGKLFS